MRESRIKYDKENNIATYTFLDRGREFTGKATCHPLDADMCTEYTGIEIARRRAVIEYLKFTRDQIRSELQALNHFYSTIYRSNSFNENAYENKMLRRQIQLTNDDLTVIRQELAMEQQNLKTYINEKEKFYQKVRDNRQKAKNN